MEKISWLDKVTNEEALRRVNEDRQILNSVWQRKHRWIGHVLRHDGLLHEIIEGRMKGKPTRGRRIQMLHDFSNDGGSVALKWASEDREVWRQRKDFKNLLYSRRLLMMMGRRVALIKTYGALLHASSVLFWYNDPKTMEISHLDNIFCLIWVTLLGYEICMFHRCSYATITFSDN